MMYAAVAVVAVAVVVVSAVILVVGAALLDDARRRSPDRPPIPLVTAAPVTPSVWSWTTAADARPCDYTADGAHMSDY